MKKAMIDIAFDSLKAKNKAVVFINLWNEVCEAAGFTQAQAEDNIAQFYSDLSLDDRFVCIEGNQWDLRERHTYNEVVIDTEDILIDEESDDDDYGHESTAKKDKNEDY